MPSAEAQATVPSANAIDTFAVDPRRRMFDPLQDPLRKLLRQARFNVGDQVYLQDQLHVVVRRFYRRSSNTILYDVRHHLTGRVLADIHQQELKDEREQWGTWKPRGT
jgi:hypothetical protein